MPSRTPVQAAVAASILIGTPVQAQDPISVEPVVVTATRTAQIADDAVAPVDVITREQIEQSGATSVNGLLRGRTGIDVSSDGAFGKSASVNIRGLGSGKILYLINGRRISDPASIEGAPSIEHIPVAQIERIEVVRGPRSSLYGSEALGGVINVITRERDDSPLLASVGVGSHSSKTASASLGGRGDRISYNLSANAFETEGYDVRDDDFDDRDGYENQSISGRLQYDVSKRIAVALDMLVDQGTTEYDGCSFPESGDCETDFEQESVGASVDAQVTDRWDARVQVSSSSEERRYFADGRQMEFGGEYRGTTTTASWQNDVQIGSTQLATLGLEDTTDRVSQPDDLAEDERGRQAAFGQWQVSVGGHDLVVGARQIDDEQFGTHTTGSIDYGVEIADGLRALASAGTGFKAPTLYQLYSQFGEPELDAERSTSVEFGLEGESSWGGWAVRTYRTEVDDLIRYDLATSLYENRGEVRIDGLEVETQARIGQWDAQISYSWSEPVDQDTGAVLPNHAERGFRLDLDRNLGAWSAGGSLVAQSARTAGAGDSVAGYGIVNLHASYQVARDWTVRGTLENALDNDYQTNDAYFAAGRTGFVHLEYRPGV